MSSSLHTEKERAFAHGLEAGLAVIEKCSVSGCKNDKHTFFGLHFAALKLGFHVSAAFCRNCLVLKKENELTDTSFI